MSSTDFLEFNNISVTTRLLRCPAAGSTRNSFHTVRGQIDNREAENLKDAIAIFTPEIQLD